jgi:hypothetical protein
VKAGQPLTFLVSATAWGPQATYQTIEAVMAASPTTPLAYLYKLEVDSKAATRQVVSYESTNYVVYGKSKMSDFRGIPLNVGRYDAQTVKIEPRSPLAPGEYAFQALVGATDPYAAQNQGYYYCFGVD